ncbi:MAG: hypothetical protein LBB66_09820 [Desulfovibrio sp.]|jgi:hypothetical protein|nr:hypothetical protein [Desulfovibrio sp.]
MEKKSFIDRLKEDGEDFAAMIVFDSNESRQTCLYARSDPFGAGQTHLKKVYRLEA